MKQSEFIDRLIQFEGEPTVYVNGAFGAVASDKNKKRYKNVANLSRWGKIDKCPSNGFFADCCGLVKGILWGWNGDTSKVYGGAVYRANGIPDVNELGLLNACKDVSTDFSHISPGELVWMKGHCGVYIGNGTVIESTPAWDCRVQKTGLGNTGNSVYSKSRIWTKHGKLPWVEYESNPIPLVYTSADFRKDVRKILNASTDLEAFEKTVTISTSINRNHALVTPLERYFRELGYYLGEIEADHGQRPCFGNGMKEATKLYQQLIVGSTGRNVDGVLDRKAQTWKKLLLGE